MNWLILTFYLTLGMVNEQNFISYNDLILTTQTPKNSLETSLGAKAILFEHFTFEAFITTDMTANTLTSYYPFQSKYGVRGEIDFGPFSLVATHECDHPVIYGFSENSQKSLYGSTLTRVYLRIEARKVY